MLICRYYYILLLMFEAGSGTVGSGTATSWKVMGLIPDGGTGILHCLNPSGCTKAQELAQLLTEMSNRDISWGAKVADAQTLLEDSLSMSLRYVCFIDVAFIWLKVELPVFRLLSSSVRLSYDGLTLSVPAVFKL
jgi:hypothetical protein